MSTVGVIGGGTMGSGIAQVAVTNGWDVRLLEVSRPLAEKAIDGIRNRLSRLVEKHKLSSDDAAMASARLKVAESSSDLADCDLIIEAVIEELGAKKEILASVLKCVPNDTVIASNTSSLSITELGRALGAGHRVCGMHFFNPVPLMPLVEIIAGLETSRETLGRATEAAQAWGKPVVRVNDHPGFIVNRVARPFYLEALRILDEKKAGCDSIDLVMRDVGGFRMGPFELMDLVGIDVNYAVSCSIYGQSGRPARFKPSLIQKQLVDQGSLGRKSGVGFYDYRHGKPELNYRVEVEEMWLTSRLKEAWDRLARAGKWDVAAETGYILGRILCAIMNEAALAEEQGVAHQDDIDVAMKLGTNYPKGPLEWAEAVGRHEIGEFLRALNGESDDERFAPAKRFMV